jgi:hypothetical protein
MRTSVWLVAVLMCVASFVYAQRRERPAYIEQKVEWFRNMFPLAGTSASSPQILGWGNGCSPSNSCFRWFAWRDNRGEVWFAFNPPVLDGDIAILEEQHDAIGLPWEVIQLPEQSEVIIRTTGPGSSLDERTWSRSYAPSLHIFHRIGFRMDLVEVPKVEP